MAERYVTRLKRCLTAIKILIVVSIAAIAALVIFIIVAAGTDMQSTNVNGLLIGVIVPGFLAAAGVAGALAVLVVAKITLNKLKKLGAEES